MSDVVKAYLKIEGETKALDCLFNPESYTVTKRNTWENAGAAASSTGSDGTSDSTTSGSKAGSTGATTPKPKQVEQQEYIGTEAATLGLTLTFDTTDQGTSVAVYTSKILNAMEVKADLPGTTKGEMTQRPPKVQFGWGQQISWWAVITSATVVFEFFSSEGVPLRAKVTLELKQAGPSNAFTRQNPTSGTPRPHQIHRVQRGETLDRISARYYGDSTRWRLLAAANGVEDPLGLRPGSLLAIPDSGV